MASQRASQRETKIAGSAGRYDEMVESMKKDAELTTVEDNLTLWTSDGAVTVINKEEVNYDENAFEENWGCEVCGQQNLKQAAKVEHEQRHEREQRLTEQELVEREERKAREIAQQKVAASAKAELDKLRRAEQRVNMYNRRAKYEEHLTDRKNERGRVVKSDKSVKGR